MTETKKRKMSAAQRRARKRKIRNRRIAMTVALVLVVALASVGGTIAWLTAQTEAVTNTFTVGNINIELAETTGETYKMVPGNTIAKNPTVTVKANSEACWLFVKIEESTNLTNFISYTVDSGWTKLQDGVYIGCTGPCYETPAEYKFFRKIGSDVVGMSTIPEIIVARHCGLTCFGMSVVTDLAHDDMPEDYHTDGEEIVKAADQAACKMTALFEKMIERL